MSDDLKTNYTKLNKKYQEIKRQLAEKEEILHNRDKWIAELERQLNLSRAGERVALKGCKELEEKLKEVEGQYAYECECNKQFVECQNENEKLKAEKEKIIKDIENKNYYGIMNKDTKKLKNTAGLDVDVFDNIIISSDLEKIKKHIHIDYLYNCVPVKIVLEELC